MAPLAQMVVKRGNPFFLEETVRTLVETGALAGERGAYRLTRPVEALQVPATLQTILAARIDRLPADEKQLLQIISDIVEWLPCGSALSQGDARGTPSLEGKLAEKGAIPKASTPHRFDQLAEGHLARLGAHTYCISTSNLWGFMSAAGESSQRPVPSSSRRRTC
jgi:hypothetical protein